ncbi:MAG: winged helix-turn-helix transcriptional regulator, partial [Campylobacterales bacterium]|nr:winged helix-turn-helix transcriptional regulator [Campylobacterales bacterium]
VIAAFKAYGLSEPTFEATQGGMLVTAYKAEEVNGGVNGGVNSGVNGGVNDIYAFVLENPGLKARDISEKTGTALRTLERILKQLKDDDKIIFKGAPKTGGYYVLEARK